MARQLTNEQVLLKGIKTLNHLEQAILRERLLAVAEETLKEAKKNPEEYGKGFFAPGLIEQTMEKIINVFDFKN